MQLGSEWKPIFFPLLKESPGLMEAPNIVILDFLQELAWLCQPALHCQGSDQCLLHCQLGFSCWRGAGGQASLCCLGHTQGQRHPTAPRAQLI